MTKLWLLDFDGTLVDSEKAIKNCYLKVCEKLLPNRCGYIKKMLIGHTLDESVRMILTEKNLDLFDSFKRHFEKLYDEKMVLETQMYRHATSTLKTLYENGDHLCIITNKRSIPTRKLLDLYGWTHFFKWIFCMDEYPSLKNKSELLDHNKINKSFYKKIYLIGDTLNDGYAAKKNNINFIKANYGYGKKEDWSKVDIFLSIDNINEILDIND